MKKTYLRKEHIMFLAIILIICALCAGLIGVELNVKSVAGAQETTASVWDGTSSDTSWYNDKDSEFTITAAAQFAGFASLVNSGKQFVDQTVYLANDIDLNNVEWSSKFIIYGTFKGVLDGRGHTISNLKVEGFLRPGLFTANFHGTARNIVFKNANVSGNDSAGVFAYDITSDTALIENVTIDSCTVVCSGGNAGGIVGWTDCTIKNCLVKNSTITSNAANAGGITGAGQLYKGAGLIYNCGSIGNTITAATGNYAGKIIGKGESGGTAEACYSDGAAVGNNDGTYIEKNNRTDIASIDGFDMSVVSVENNVKTYATTKSFDSIAVEFVAVPSNLTIKENDSAVEFNLTDRSVSFASSAGTHTYLLEYTVLEVVYSTKIVVGIPGMPRLTKTIDGVGIENAPSFITIKDGDFYICDVEAASGNQFAIGFESALADGAKAVVKYGENSVTITGSETANLGKMTGGAYTIEYYYNDILASSATFNDIKCVKSLGVEHLFYTSDSDSPWIYSDDVNGFKGMYSSKIGAYGKSAVDIIAVNTDHVSFNVASSSESKYDDVKIYFEGKVYREREGEDQKDINKLSWDRVVFDFKQSEFNVITITYTKDGASDAGNDTGYVNDFRGGILSSPTEAEYVITVDGIPSRQTIENGGTISVDYDKETSLSFTAPIMENVVCELYVQGDKSADAPTVDQGVYFYYVQDAKTVSQVSFVYSKEGLDSASFTYNIDFEPSAGMQSNLVIGGNVSVDSSDYKDKTEDVPYFGTAHYYPFGFNGNLSARTGWLVYSSTSQGKDLSVSGIKLIVKESGLLTFDYYVSADNTSAPYDSVYTSNEAIGYNSAQQQGKYFPSGKSLSEDLEHASVGSTGEVGWQKYSLAVDVREGESLVIHLAYVKGGSVSAGDDVFAIANIKLDTGVKNVTYSADDEASGSVEAMIVGGASVNSGSTVAMGTKITLSATANDGCKVYGWQNVATGEITTSSSVTITVVEAVEYKAIIKPLGTYTALAGNRFYATIEKAQSANPAGTIYVIENCVLSDFTVLNGVTLVLQYSQSDKTGYAQGGSHARVSWFDGEDPYITLTVNGTLTINGKLIVGGVQHKADQTAQGHTSGAYSQIVNNGSIVIVSGGYLDVIGRVTGSGTISLNAGATLREPFMVNNYAGGTNTYTLYNEGQFPFVQFATVNVECKQIVSYGAKIIGSTSLYFWSSITTQDVVLVDKYENRTVSSEGSLIWMQEGSRLEISYDRTNTIDRLHKEGKLALHLGDSGVTTIDVYGAVTAGEFYLQGYGSKDMVLSVPYTYNFNVKNGGKIIIEQKYKVMPGAVITVASGGEILVEKSGALYVYDGLIQAMRDNKQYPQADVLSKYGFNKSGMFVVDGLLTVNGTFAGIVQTNGSGTITVGNDANVGNQTIVDGANGGYDGEKSSDRTEFETSARAYALNGFITLEKGKTYKAFSQDSFVLDTFTAISAARMSNLTVELNQAMTGRFLEWNGTKFVADSITFSLSRELVGKRVTIEGVEYVVPEDGKITINDFAFSGSKEITYFTSEYEKASVSHSRPVTLGENILDEAIVKAELDESNDYFRILNADGSVKEDFVVNVVVTYLNGETVKTEWAYGEVTTFTNDNVEISHQNYSVTFKHAFYVVDKAVEQYISEVTVLKDSENISSEAVTLYAKYKELITASSETYNAFVVEYLVNYTAYAGVVVKNVKVVSAPVYGDTNAEATRVKVDGSETTDTVNVSVEDMRAEGVELKCSLVYVGEFEGKSYSVTVETNAVKRDLTVNISNKESVYGEAEVTLTASADSSTPLAYEDKIDNIGITLVKASGVNVGKYDITGTYDGYFYNVTFNDGKYEIKPFDVNIEVLDIRNLMEGYDKIVISSRTNEETPDSDFVTKLTYEIYSGEELKATVKNGTITGTLVAGAYTVKAVNADNNYNVVSVKPAELTVVKANAYYTVEVSDGKVYDNTPITDLKSIVSVTITDTKEAVTEYAVKAKLDGKEVNELRLAGSYEIEITINETGKEQASYSRVYEISKREITVRIQDKESVYGEATEELTAYVDEFTLANGENANVLGISLVKEDGKNVGTYTISGTYTNNNYDITFVNGTYTVKPKNITVTIQDKESVYGEDAVTLTFVVDESTLANGENASVLSISLVKEDGKNVGTYTISGTYTNNNYDITFANGTYTVKPKNITVTIHDKESVYGEKVQELTWKLNSDLCYDDKAESLNVTLTRSENLNVGEYDILGTWNNENYNVTFRNSNGNSDKGKYVITAKPVIVTVNDATQVYGEEETELTYVLNEEDLAYEDSKENLNVVLSRTQGKNVGSYDITATYDNKNYSVTFDCTNGKASKYTITACKITIKVNDISNFSFNKTYEDFAELLGFTVAADSYTIVDGDEINVTYTLTINGTVINASNYSFMICGGKHDILAEASNDNYDITVVKGSLEVTKPKVSVKDIVTEFVYDDGNAIPVFDWTKNISGKLDSANERSFKATFKRLVNGAETSEELTSITEAGTYLMTISIVHEDAYEFADNSVNAYTVTVKKKDISSDMTVVGTKEGNRFAQRHGISIYAILDTYAGMGISINSTFTVNGTETDSPYELGEYGFTAVIENDNYEGTVSYSFTIVPSVIGKTEELKQDLDAYDANASSSVRFQALTAMRNLVLSLTEDDLAQIEEDQEYTALLNRYVAAYTEYLEDMAEDVSVARKVANNSLAELIAMISGAAVAFWFGLKQSQGK